MEWALAARICCCGRWTRRRKACAPPAASPACRRARWHQQRNSNPKRKGLIMARYLTLIRFTEQGAKTIKKSTARAADFRAAAEKVGVKVEAQYWTTGAYDGVLIL